ncbi:MAG: hypothetical protein WBK20_11645 [Spirochaetota bacterium]
MKNIFNIIMIFIWIAITPAYANESIIPKKIYDDDIAYGINYGKEHFILVTAIKGNFISSMNEEYIAFYKIDNRENLYNTVRIYIIKKNKIIKVYRINHVSYMDYNDVADGNDFYIKQIKALEQYFGPWNGYFYTYDLNGNGVPEIFLYDLGGIGGSWGIYEYNKEKDAFETIIDAGQLYNYGKVIIDKQNKAIIIYAHYEPKGNYPAYVLHYREIEYKWNEKSKRYEKKVLRKGLTYEDLEKIKN